MTVGFQPEIYKIVLNLNLVENSGEIIGEITIKRYA